MGLASLPRPYSVGAEEELMILDGEDLGIAGESDGVLEALPSDLAERVFPETHAGALELNTGVHATAGSAAAELEGLRTRLAAELERKGLRAASAGTTRRRSAWRPSGAIPDPSYIWWDLRLKPDLGTIEFRAMDAQRTVDETAALIALVQCLVRAAVEGSEPGAGDPRGARREPLRGLPRRPLGEADRRRPAGGGPGRRGADAR